MPSDRVPTLTAAADALLVMLRAGPLYDRSLPTKLVEGLAAGRPLIVAAGGDAAELVADSGAGIVCPPEDSVALRAALIQMANTADRQAFGRAGVQLARRRFDRGVIAARLADLLKEAAEPERHE